MKNTARCFIVSALMYRKIFYYSRHGVFVLIKSINAFILDKHLSIRTVDNAHYYSPFDDDSFDFHVVHLLISTAPQKLSFPKR